MIQSTHVSSAHDTIYVQVEHLPGKNICLTDSHPQVTWPDVALPSMPTGRSHRPSEALGLEMSSCGTTRHGAANWRPMRLLPASTARWYLLNMIQSMYLLNMIVSVYIEVEYLSGKNVYPSLSPSSHFGLSSNYYSELHSSSCVALQNTTLSSVVAWSMINCTCTIMSAATHCHKFYMQNTS